MYLLGLDIGSSSVKAALFDTDTQTSICMAQSPDTEMPIDAPRPGWAEQDPDMWWEHVKRAVGMLFLKQNVDKKAIKAIGIAYQMHGLVALDTAGKPVRPAIIWCDSRAVETGNSALEALGEDFCFPRYLNAPGNFTAAKLAWVRRHEPELYRRIHKIMLPGDYIAYRLTGEAATTLPGLSEGILWDFYSHKTADELLTYYNIDKKILADPYPVFGRQGMVNAASAADLGLPAGIPVAYRAGDQPNNALSLRVLEPGEIAATGGTSGVVYGVSDRLTADRSGRVNSFAHVNHTREQPRIGVLLCLNGAGSLYRWLRQQTAQGLSYDQMEQLAAAVPAGADGMSVLPFGNGAERLLRNQNPGAHVCALDFNRHQQAHLFRAGLEGIAFSFTYGLQAFDELGIRPEVIRVGNDNLFRSAVFSQTLSDLLGCRIEMLSTTGATGAAIGAGFGAGIFSSLQEGLSGLKPERCFDPRSAQESLVNAYERWQNYLRKIIN